MFEILKTKIANQGQLLYTEKSHEFKSKPSINSDITILLGYIYIGFNSENNEATQIWGFHHNFNWKQKSLNPPKFVQGKVILKIDLNPGDSKRIVEANLWKTEYDKNNGWIRFGELGDSYNNNYVEIFSNTLVGIDNNGCITDLWLNPIKA